MALKAPKLDNLDDLRFQQLVDEARRRIPLYCSSWTDFNLSDPGITLVELFAWMTELLAYRINQVPEKNYVKFLEMLGEQLQPAYPARVDLTFRLSTPFPLRVNEPDDGLYTFIHAGTKVSNGLAADATDELVFTTDEPLEIRAPRLRYFYNGQWQPVEEINPIGQRLVAFGEAWNPTTNQASFTLAFDASHNISGHVLRLNVQCEENLGTGIRRDQPPLRWFCYTGEEDGGEAWTPIAVGKTGDDRDSTGGFNNPTGHLTLFLPPQLGTKPITSSGDKDNQQAVYMVRCDYRYNQKDPTNRYNHSPVIKRITAQTVGATVSATNAVWVQEEELGVSSGEPGQSFSVDHQPMVKPTKKLIDSHFTTLERFLHPDQPPVDETVPDRDLAKTTPIAEGTGAIITTKSSTARQVFQSRTNAQEIEIIEIEESHNGQVKYQRWQPVDDFSKSSRHDRHYILDRAAGEIRLGPAIQASDGTVKQYGRVPLVDRRVRIRRYCYSGGAKGNLAEGQINILHEAFPYVDSVKNLRSAFGGLDVETLDAAKERSKQLMRVQRRAVTAMDYERLTCTADKRVARAKCLPPVTTNGTLPRLQILVIPVGATTAQLDTLGYLSLEHSHNAGLRKAIHEYLDAYRMVTTAIEVREPDYVAVWLQVLLLVDRTADVVDIQNTVRQLLNQFITPLYRYEIPVDDEPTIEPDGDTGQNQDMIASLLPDEWSGWPFGRPLSQAELLAMIQKIPGVDYVKTVKIHYRALSMLIELTPEEQEQLETPQHWQQEDGNFLAITPASVLCTIGKHDIKVQVRGRD